MIRAIERENGWPMDAFYALDREQQNRLVGEFRHRNKAPPKPPPHPLVRKMRGRR